MSKLAWPEDLGPDVAHLHVVNRLETELSPERLWPHLVRAGAWSSFYANCKRLRFENHEGPELRADSVFTWWTFGVPVRTVVTDFVPARRLAWRGSGLGAEGYHGWLLEPLPHGGTLFVTEETQRGFVPRVGKALLRRGLSYWHQRWLEGIVRAASSS